MSTLKYSTASVEAVWLFVAIESSVLLYDTVNVYRALFQSTEAQQLLKP
jgi:hypothetical protein